MNANKTTTRLTITVRRHPLYPTHFAGTVETAKGRVFTCTWAGDENGEGPTEAKVLEAWKADRKAFTPGYC